MDCDFSVVGMVVGVHLAHVGDWLIIYVIFLKTLRNVMCDWMWESVFVIFIQYVLFIKMLLHTEIWLYLYSFWLHDKSMKVNKIISLNWKKTERLCTQSVQPNGQGNEKSICRTYTFHSVFILAFVYYSS